MIARKHQAQRCRVRASRAGISGGVLVLTRLNETPSVKRHASICSSSAGSDLLFHKPVAFVNPAVPFFKRLSLEYYLDRAACCLCSNGHRE
jgi:hypothetical protein